MMLVIFMFIGGCAGSTSGGLKIIRTIISTKTCFRNMRQTILSPRSIMLVKYNSKVLSEDTIRAVFGFMALYGIFFLFGSFFLLASEPSCDIETATTASIACLSTVGPGLGKVGPLQNYAWISAPGKWMLSFLMIAGRLELYAILALFLPKTWQK
jgi:trk system potassium uptake protein TrkH